MKKNSKENIASHPIVPRFGIKKSIIFEVVKKQSLINENTPYS